jgi:peroxiredoxin
MKRILFIALVAPLILLSCSKSTQEKGKEQEKDKKEEKKSEKEVQADIKASTVIEEGQEVPGFSFTTTEGKSYSMKDLKGKVVLLNFFATWCPTCMKEMPALQKQVWDKYKSSDEFFMVSIGREHSMKEMNEFKHKKPYDFHFAPDTGRVIYKKFAKKYIPRNVLVDRKGKIIYQCTGYKEDEFKKMLGVLEKKL